MHRTGSGFPWWRPQRARGFTRSLLLGISLAALAIPRVTAEAHCPANLLTIPYHSLYKSQFAIPVRIEQSQPYDFLVDTASQITIVDPELAEELHLQPQGSVDFTNLSNNSRAFLTRAGTVEAGSHVVRSLLIAVKELGQIRAVNPSVRGILGENFLARFDLLIDYRHRILCLDAGSAMEHQLRGEHLTLELGPDNSSDEPFPRPLRIRVHLSDAVPGRKDASMADRRGTMLKLDSGANVAILFAPRVGAVVANLREGSVLGGSDEFFALLPPQDVSIGQRSLCQVVFVAPVIQRRLPASRIEDGVLPTALFHRIFVSYRDRTAILDPR